VPALRDWEVHVLSRYHERVPEEHMRPVIRVRERLLLRHLLNGAKGVRGNARKAAIAAGYKDSRYLDDQLRRLFRRPRIQAALADALHRWDVTQERILAEYARIAFANITQAITVEARTGTVVLRKDLESQPDVTAAIAEVRSRGSENGSPRVSVRMHNKLAALDMLAKFLGLIRSAELNVTLVHLMGNLNLSALSTEELQVLRTLLTKALHGTATVSV
jgi:hypothetical protein